MRERAAAMRNAFMHVSVDFPTAKSAVSQWTRRNGLWKITAYAQNNNINDFSHPLVEQQHRDMDATLTAETLQRISDIDACVSKAALTIIFDRFSNEFDGRGS